MAEVTAQHQLAGHVRKACTTSEHAKFQRHVKATTQAKHSIRSRHLCRHGLHELLLLRGSCLYAQHMLVPVSYTYTGITAKYCVLQAGISKQKGVSKYPVFLESWQILRTTHLAAIASMRCCSSAARAYRRKRMLPYT